MHGYKNFIRFLPGPQSYCKCTSLCSQVTVEHVIPKSLIKSSGLAKGCANDLHNLYPCCSKLNGDKGSLIFGKDFVFNNDYSNHTGALARASLYMYDKYELPIDKKTVALWRVLDKVYVPKEFEIIRNNMIYDITKNDNNYLINHFIEEEGYGHD